MEGDLLHAECIAPADGRAHCVARNERISQAPEPGSRCQGGSSESSVRVTFRQSICACVKQPAPSLMRLPGCKGFHYMSDLWMLRGQTSSLVSSANRRHRERMSPTAGPPNTRTISAVLPPSSETGSTCATRVVSCRRWPGHPQEVPISGKTAIAAAAESAKLKARWPLAASVLLLEVGGIPSACFTHLS